MYLLAEGVLMGFFAVLVASVVDSITAKLWPPRDEQIDVSLLARHGIIWRVGGGRKR